MLTLLCVCVRACVVCGVGHVLVKQEAEVGGGDEMLGQDEVQDDAHTSAPAHAAAMQQEDAVEGEAEDAEAMLANDLLSAGAVDDDMAEDQQLADDDMGEEDADDVEEDGV